MVADYKGCAFCNIQELRDVYEGSSHSAASELVIVLDELEHTRAQLLEAEAQLQSERDRSEKYLAHIEDNEPCIACDGYKCYACGDRRPEAVHWHDVWLAKIEKLKSVDAC